MKTNCVKSKINTDNIDSKTFTTKSNQDLLTVLVDHLQKIRKELKSL